jgi:hypothetical protein
MTTQNSLRQCEMQDENADITILRYELQDEIRNGEVTFRQRIVQWFGRLSTLALGVATLAPNALHISAGFRPWVFVAFILWVTAFVMGVFNP